MKRNRYVVPGFIVAAAVIFFLCEKSIAVVPETVYREEKPRARTKEARLLEIIEKIKTHEEENIKFYNEIEKELQKVVQKEEINREK